MPLHSILRPISSHDRGPQHRWIAVLLLVVSLVLATPVVAQQDASDDDNPYRVNSKPKAAEDIGVDSKTGDPLPMELKFRDSEQRLIELGTLFDGTRPVMLSFNYSNCPKLCSVQLENMTLTLREVAKRFQVNRDFQMVSISIDPNEQWTRAAETKAKYVTYYNQPDSEAGFRFLTGDRESIQQLADACGFRYKYIPAQKFYSHPPVFILISPDGKIVRYIHGLKYDAETMEQALIEAASGKIGSPINLLSYGLGCYVFDESTGQYTFQAMAIMRAGGLLTIVVLAVTLLPYWFFRRGLPVETGQPTQAVG